MKLLVNEKIINIRVGGFLRSAMAGTAGRDGKVTVTDYSKNVHDVLVLESYITPFF